MKSARIRITVCLLAVLLLLGIIGLVVAWRRHIIAVSKSTHRITGIASFNLGSILNKNGKPDENGEFSYFESGTTNIQPFDSILVSADQHRIIYAIMLYMHPLSARAPRKLKEVLDESYPMVETTNAGTWNEYHYGDRRRRIDLAVWTNGASVELQYLDFPLMERVNATRKAALEKKLDSESSKP